MTRGIVVAFFMSVLLSGVIAPRVVFAADNHSKSRPRLSAPQGKALVKLAQDSTVRNTLKENNGVLILGVHDQPFGTSFGRATVNRTTLHLSAAGLAITTQHVWAHNGYSPNYDRGTSTSIHSAGDLKLLWNNRPISLNYQPTTVTQLRKLLASPWK